MKVFIINSRPFDRDYVSQTLTECGMSSTGIITEAELILCIGGDATILQSVQYAHYHIPVMGVNTGTLGYLSNDLDLKDALRGFNNREHDFDKLQIFKVTIDNGRIYHFLNEVSIIGIESGKLVHSSMYINGEYINTYKGDGVIISTATGSTAWSLSAGGSIVSPDLKCVLITPNNPFSLNHRPLIISSENVVKFEDIDKIVIDGSDVLYTSTVKIEPVAYDLKLARSEGVSFYDRIKAKIGWGGNIKE